MVILMWLATWAIAILFLAPWLGTINYPNAFALGTVALVLLQLRRVRWNFRYTIQRMGVWAVAFPVFWALVLRVVQ